MQILEAWSLHSIIKPVLYEAEKILGWRSVGTNIV